MPLHDFRCRTCGHVQEHRVEAGTTELPCPRCTATADRVFLVAPKPDWLGLAQGDSASPEAVDRFERMHKQQAEKESKSFKEHGDYGPRPGSDGGSNPND